MSLPYRDGDHFRSHPGSIYNTTSERDAVRVSGEVSRRRLLAIALAAGLILGILVGLRVVEGPRDYPMGPDFDNVPVPWLDGETVGALHSGGDRNDAFPGDSAPLRSPGLFTPLEAS